MNRKTDINRVSQQIIHLYTVRKSDLKKCAHLMACAFDNDPSIRYLLGGTEQGRNDWRYFHTVLGAVFGKCIMLSNDSELNDLLILFPPALKAVPTLPFLLNGGIKLPTLFEKGLLIRSLKYEANCKRMKEKIAPSDAWYCMCFVVKPELQGKGRGSRLIRSAIRALDCHRASLYLETHKYVNVELYKHLGFQVKASSPIPSTDIIQYGMLRTPNMQL